MTELTRGDQFASGMQRFRRGGRSVSACFRRPSALALVLSTSLFLTACSEDGRAALVVGSSTPEAAAPTSAGASGFVLRITEDGFSPASVEVPEGSVVRLTNDSETGRTVMVSDVIDGDGETIEPGETLQLALPKVGAYVVTSPGNTEFTATITVLAGEDQ